MWANRSAKPLCYYVLRLGLSVFFGFSALTLGQSRRGMWFEVRLSETKLVGRVEFVLLGFEALGSLSKTLTSQPSMHQLSHLHYKRAMVLGDELPT